MKTPKLLSALRLDLARDSRRFLARVRSVSGEDLLATDRVANTSMVLRASGRCPWQSGRSIDCRLLPTWPSPLADVMTIIYWIMRQIRSEVWKKWYQWDLARAL